MIFSTITQTGLNLTADTTEIPAQYSNNIQFKFVQDTENYSGYTPTVCATLYDSSLIECADVLNAGGNVPIENGIFTIGNQILYQSGYLAIGITLTNGDENVTLLPVIYKVKGSVGGLSPLPPDTGEWQQVVDAYVNTLFNNWSEENLTPIQTQLENLVSEAQQQQETASNQQTQIDNAISVMGDYQIVSEDPVQIQFKKGDGDFGPTVDLGDGLASKSMVNGKYYQSAAEIYSGAASNYGIQVQQIMGAYVQDGTPTPDNPVEPQFNVINNFNTNGGNLFDASKLPTTSQGGATVTNNGDGSFTISGSGNLSDTFALYYEETDFLNLIKKGNLNVAQYPDSSLYFYVQLVNLSGGILKQANSTSPQTIEITQEDISNTAKLRFGYYGTPDSVITNITMKPMVWQDGDGTWYPFNASNTPVSLELRALPDGTADVLEDGSITRNVAKVTFDGSIDEKWESYNLFSYNGYYINMPNMRTGLRQKFLCNIYKANGLNDDGVWFGVNSSLGYFPKAVADTGAQTLEEWRTWLSQNPIDVYYALATPTTEPLAIPTLTSYYPFTNAWCDSQVPGMITWNVLTGNVKNDELDPVIQEYVNGNVPDLISNYVSQNVPEMITSAINSALASYCPFAVGDIYITSSNAHPNTKYPGTTWKAIRGETLVGYLKGDPNFGTLGASVGEATHTLTVDEMPSHSHGAGEVSNGFITSGSGENAGLLQGSDAYVVKNNTSNTGGGQAHNNIQPSRVVMIWQRTA